MKFVVVHSEDPTTSEAIAEMLAAAQAQVGGERVRGGLLLAGIDHDHGAALAAIVAAFPGIGLIGCTTDGEMSSVMGFCEGSLLLLLLLGEDFEVSVGLGRGVDQDPAAAAAAAVSAAKAGLSGPVRLCLTTPESLTCDAVALIEGLRAALGAEVPVLGGTAADGWRFRFTRQFCGGSAVSDGVPVLLLSGDFSMSFGLASGWAPIGRSMTVSRSSGNVVHQIGEATAIDFYQQMLGDHVLPSGEYPLAVTADGGVYLRAPVGYDLKDGSITFAGSVPAGSLVQLTAAGRDEIVAASSAAIEGARAGLGVVRPAGALLISCAARKQLLGTRTGEEAAMLRDGALAGVPFVGFYAYGELSPLRAGEMTLFHNETFVTALLGSE